MPDKVKLGDLEIGDRFIALSRYNKRKPVFEVLSKPQFNRAHGSSTRNCRNVYSGQTESKSCRMEVVKLN